MFLKSSSVTALSAHSGQSVGGGKHWWSSLLLFSFVVPPGKMCLFSEPLGWKLSSGDGAGCCALIPRFKRKRIAEQLGWKCLLTPHDAPSWFHLCDSSIQLWTICCISYARGGGCTHAPQNCCHCRSMLSFTFYTDLD